MLAGAGQHFWRRAEKYFSNGKSKIVDWITSFRAVWESSGSTAAHQNSYGWCAHEMSFILERKFICVHEKDRKETVCEPCSP